MHDMLRRGHDRLRGMQRFRQDGVSGVWWQRENRMTAKTALKLSLPSYRVRMLLRRAFHSAQPSPLPLSVPNVSDRREQAE